MLNRNALLLVAGAAIFALDASAATAQARPTSTRRIPVSKEAPGEVAPPRVDTVTVYRTDTLRMQGRTDTLRLTNTVTRVDTVTQQINMAPRMVGGLYFGIAGGTNLPYGGIRSVNNPAATGQLQVGWQGLNSPLGIRADVMYNQFSESAQYAALGPKPDLINGNLDLRLNVPFFTNFLGSAARFQPYLLGGGSYARYRNLRMQREGVDVNPATVAAGFDRDKWHDDFGYNYGLGLGIKAGKKEVFMESRVITWDRGRLDNSVTTGRYHTAREIPIVFGINFF